MGYSAYPNYTDSINEWIGRMPSHWVLLRADFTTRSNKLQVSTDEMKDEQVLHYSIPNVQEFGTARVEEGSEIDSSKLRIDETQLLISKLNPRKATVCVAEPHAEYLTVCSGEFVPIVPEGELLLSYCYYVWLSDKVTKLLSSRVQSVTRSHQRVNPDDIRKLLWAFPPPPEQQHIADFLDWKTGQIDALIAKKRQLIEKLQEKRIAVITRAVTKGLNPDVPMKDSGIPWLGEVPEGWKVKKLKFSVSKVGSGVTPKGGAEAYEQSGIPLLRSQNIYFDGLRMDDVVFILQETHEAMANSQVKEGDVLINITGASIGRCYFADKSLGEANVNQHVCIIRPEASLLTRFLHYLLSSDLGQLYIQLEQGGSGREGLNFVSIKNFVFPLPPTFEQQLIVDYVNEVLNKFDSLVSKAKDAVQRLTEYRTALITAATTGKIDVRNVAIPASSAEQLNLTFAEDEEHHA